jgi:hypothetical protein
MKKEAKNTKLFPIPWNRVQGSPEERIVTE